jgi:hypothetical protein
MNPTFESELQLLFETEERQTVGDSFGGTQPATKKNFSIATIRNWVIKSALNYKDSSPVAAVVHEAAGILCTRELTFVVGALIRHSFLIELTNLKVGSTKMKTRWMPGLILKPQATSFEPIQGEFSPRNDPRSASYVECIDIFTKLLRQTCQLYQINNNFREIIGCLANCTRVSYEFPVAYSDLSINPVHASANINISYTDDLLWLVKARQILKSAPDEFADAISEIVKSKLEVKVYKTDRSLTGNDKTNRAKRWEILFGDFQFASLQNCWSVERALTIGLVMMRGFPESIRRSFIETELISPALPETRCPVTLDVLSFDQLAEAVLKPKHGRADYQIGHLMPLKRGGTHLGPNVCWQSADGNRIQGDLSIDETQRLLRRIELNRLETENANPQQPPA